MRSLFVPFVCVLALAACTPEQPHNVTVQGECLKKVMPDRASLNVTVSLLKSNVKEASGQTQDLYKKIVADIKELKLADTELETSEYTVNEEYTWEGEHNQRVLKGYRARMGITVSTTEISRIGEVMEVSSRYPAVEAGQFTIYTSPQRHKEVHEECLTEAVENARSKAERMVEAAKGRLGGLVTVSERAEFQGPQPMAFRSMAKMEMAGDMAAEQAPSIESKASDMKVTVDAVFDIR